MAKKIVKPRREFTRQQLSRWQREKRRQRIIFSIGLFVIIAVLALVASSWFIYQYKPLHETVIRVNDTKFDMNYYIKMLKYFGQGQGYNYISRQADGVVQIIERNEIIRQEAQELGFAVSNREVDKRLKSNSPPLSRDYRDIARAEILTERLKDEYFDEQVPLVAPQRHILAMLLESENQAAEVRARLERGESFTDLASELSLEGYSKLESGDLGWHSKEALAALLGIPLLGDYAFSLEVGVLSEPLHDEEVIKRTGYWLIKVMDRSEEMRSANVEIILLGTEEDAVAIRERLEAGEDFNTLAKGFSLAIGAEEDEGKVGWISPGVVTPTFDEFVFDPELEIDTLSEVIRDEGALTKGGFWLIKVLDKDDNRQIEESDRDILKAKALEEWVTSLLEDPENEIDDSYLTLEKKDWAVYKAAGGWD